ncbi:hypothetical protein Taro_009768 [Colocasia esculenta]|uniref:Uncharacterized protein n=1 Tax=Colocasia esculenta TaxID=4460 RepID=A0A843U1S7_COLES|nr:hypothetical protein [Colocasia esculenta]
MDDMGAIHFASQKGHLEVVRRLLSSGVSVKAANRKGLTPLHFAVRGSHLELVKYLVRKGASLSAKTKSGETPADLANSDEVRAVIAECGRLLKEEQMTGSKNAIKQSSAHGKDVGSKDQDEAREMAAAGKDANSDVRGMAKAVDDSKEDEREKRKFHGAEAEEDASRSKKPRVALGHLLAEDDMEEEAD